MTHTVAQVLIALVALEHIYILWIEMFAWETAGKRVFDKLLTENLFQHTKKMAANQGLYNGFLAAGLIWSFFISDLIWAENIQLFFLGCVAVAGIYGALTVSRKIFVMQALPALLSMLFVLL